VVAPVCSGALTTWLGAEFWLHIPHLSKSRLGRDPKRYVQRSTENRRENPTGHHFSSVAPGPAYEACPYMVRRDYSEDKGGRSHGHPLMSEPEAGRSAKADGVDGVAAPALAERTDPTLAAATKSESRRQARL